MYDKIREHVEFLFQGAPVNARAIELKEEVIANLIDRYNDLISQGETEEVAYHIAIDGIGDVAELIQGLREPQMWDSYSMQNARQRSALLVAIGVGLIIMSAIFPLFFMFLSQNTGYMLYELGACLMVLFVAIGIGVLIYNQKTKPQYMKTNDTIVEDFKEWNSKHKKSASTLRTIQSIIWTSTVPTFLFLGIFFHAWSRAWLIFVMAPAATQIVKLIYQSREE